MSDGFDLNDAGPQWGSKAWVAEFEWKRLALVDFEFHLREALTDHWLARCEDVLGEDRPLSLDEMLRLYRRPKA